MCPERDRVFLVFREIYPQTIAIRDRLSLQILMAIAF